MLVIAVIFLVPLIACIRNGETLGAVLSAVVIVLMVISHSSVTTHNRARMHRDMYWARRRPGRRR